MVSDGVGEEEALHCCTVLSQADRSDLAAQLLRQSHGLGEDDATVAIVELSELTVS